MKTVLIFLIFLIYSSTSAQEDSLNPIFKMDSVELTQKYKGKTYLEFLSDLREKPTMECFANWGKQKLAKRIQYTLNDSVAYIFIIGFDMHRERKHSKVDYHYIFELKDVLYFKIAHIEIKKVFYPDSIYSKRQKYNHLYGRLAPDKLLFNFKSHGFKDKHYDLDLKYDGKTKIKDLDFFELGNVDYLSDLKDKKVKDVLDILGQDYYDWGVVMESINKLNIVFLYEFKYEYIILLNLRVDYSDEKEFSLEEFLKSKVIRIKVKYLPKDRIKKLYRIYPPME